MIVRVSATTGSVEAIAADTVAVGLFDGERPTVAGAVELPAAVGELLSSGEARGAFKALALAHADGRRWLLVGLGKEADLTPERARVVAAAAHERALEIGTKQRSAGWRRRTSR